MRTLTYERLREVLSYDPETGLFVWRTPPNNHHKPGQAAGGMSEGYVRIMVDGRKYRGHRLAWLYVNREWPSGEIDHINRDGADNRILNLREASRSQNMANVGARKNSKSGIKGVYRSKGRWAAGIRQDYKTHHLGYFDTPEAAQAAYAAAATRVYGSFARTE